MSFNIRFSLGGNVIPNELVEWRDVGLLATFNQSGVQANITMDAFTFTDDAARFIRNEISNGNIFEPPDFDIQLVNSETYQAFNGFLDLNDEFREIHPGKVEAKIKQKNGLNSLQDILEANSFGFLFDQNIITTDDFVEVEYVVERPTNAIELILANITLFLLLKELAESIKRTAESIKDITVAATPSPPAQVNVGGIINASIQALINAAYTALLLIAIKDFLEQFFENILSPVRRHKCMILSKLLEKAFERAGYGFEHNIPELDRVAFLPSKPFEEDAIELGIPNASDFGYQTNEMVEIVNRCFNAKEAIVDGVVQVRTESDPYWRASSTYTLPDVLWEEKRYNTSDLFSNRIIQFRTDNADEWTLSNFFGTNFQTITIAQNPNAPNQNIVGLDRIEIPCALANRKNQLNDLEEFLTNVAAIADTVINALGGRSNLSGRLKNRVGVMKVSQNLHSVPKLVPLTGRKIPSNDRNIFSARILENNYYFERSFIRNDFRKQHRIFTGVEGPFGFSDFLSLIDNSFFNTLDGKLGKAEKIEWIMDRDKATFDFFIEEPYTKKLREIFIEPT